MTTTISTVHSEAAFYRKRKAMLVLPLIVLPFVATLFWLFDGGKGKKYSAGETQQTESGGFNAKVPNAKGGNISGREIDKPGYGVSQAGQVLSDFTNTRQDSVSSSLNGIPNNSLPASPGMAVSLGTPNNALEQTRPRQSGTRPNAAALAATGSARTRRGKDYYYNPPGVGPYYSASATDQELDKQLRRYENSRSAPPPAARVSSSTLPEEDISGMADIDTRSSSVRLSDNLTASRLSDIDEAVSPFFTAPTGGSRPQPTRAVLSGGSYGTKKTIAWMIPIVVHEDQAVREGEQIKLRLLKEISADGIAIPANTILYAVGHLSNDRLRLTVANLQLGGQLIPLDLEVYDTDGSPGVNVPGLSRQMDGQIKSSALQGVQVPGIGSVGNSVLNSARTGASNTVRQSTIRLRAGYNLFLKAQ